jgi:hypothetical protein
MTLREIIAKLDKSEKNRDWIDIDTLCTELNINNSWLDIDDRLNFYYITKWCCTDTYVGMRAYFLDDVLVAVSTKMGRRQNEDFEWVSSEAKIMVKNYILSFIEVDVVETPLDLDIELGDGFGVDYGSQLLTYTVRHTPTGEMVTVIKRFEEYKDINKWGSVIIRFDDGRELLAPLSDISVPFCITE